MRRLTEYASDDVINSSDSASVNMYGKAGNFDFTADNMLEMLRDLGDNPDTDKDSTINAQYKAGRIYYKFKLKQDKLMSF